MNPTSNDSQKLPKIYYKVLDIYFSKEEKIIFIPNATNERKSCFRVLLPIFMCYTSSRDSSRRERRESPFRKSSICIPNNLCLTNVDSVIFCVSKLRSCRSNARCCLLAYSSTTVKMTHSRLNKMTATSDNLSGTKSTWDRYGCLVSMNSLIFFAHSLWSSARKLE